MLFTFTEMWVEGVTRRRIQVYVEPDLLAQWDEKRRKLSWGQDMTRSAFIAYCVGYFMKHDRDS